MCERCTADVLEALRTRNQFKLPDRKIMTVDRVDKDDVHLKAHSPNPAFHASHAGALLHWLRSGHFICGVASGTTSIKVLTAKGSRVVECPRCSNNASALWSLLATLPDVGRDGLTGLAHRGKGP